jgi:hypothetical protein
MQSTDWADGVVGGGRLGVAGLPVIEGCYAHLADPQLFAECTTGSVLVEPGSNI